MKQTLYDILGVSPDVAFEDVEVAYDKRVAEMRGQTSWDSSRLVMLNEAREVLSDASRRAAYDASLAAAARPSVPFQSTIIDDEPRSTGKWIIAGVVLAAIAIWWVMRDDAPPGATSVARDAQNTSGTSGASGQPPAQSMAEGPTVEVELPIAGESTITQEPTTTAQAEAVVPEAPPPAEAEIDAPAKPAASAPASIVGDWDCFDPVTGRNSHYAFAGDGAVTMLQTGGERQSFAYELAGRQVTLVDADPPRTMGVEELSEHKLILNMEGEGHRMVCSR